MSTDRSVLLHKAKLAEKAERYDDMVLAMKSITESGVDLTEEERSLLAIAYKYVTAAKRASWRAVSCVEEGYDGSECHRETTKEYREMIEKELKNTCNDVQTMLEIYLIPKADSEECKVFYFKLKGDYYRYLAELTVGDERLDIVENSMMSYREAYDTSQNLSPMNPIRLGLTLNFAVFAYEILDDRPQACALVRKAFDEAQAEIDTLDGDMYKESSLILQLIKDNLAIWSVGVAAAELDC